MKIHPMTAEFIHAHGRTDRQTGGHTDRQMEMTKLIVAFHNFSNAFINGKTRFVSTYQAVCHKPCPSTIPGKIRGVLFYPP